MEQGCLMSLLFKKEQKALKTSELAETNPNFYFPIYIITESVNSCHLKPLQELFEKENILLSFQKQLHLLRKIRNTYQNRFFIILNDFKNEPFLEGEFQTIKYQIEAYPQTDLNILLKRYKKFVEKEMGCQNAQLNLLKDRNEYYLKEQQQNSEQYEKGRILLKSVSKMGHNYKSVWPKKLYIYSNRKDDEYYKVYISRIKQMSFKDASFINQIEDYIQGIPQKEDISFCILMSYYSVLNLRKYFKKCDQILLLANQKDNCLPLLRGKVTFFTTDYKCMDAALKNTFGMTPKNIYSSKLKIEEETIISQIKPDPMISSAHTSSSFETSLKCQDLKNTPGSKFKISKQFQMTSETFKQMTLQSNTFELNIQPVNRIIEKQQFEKIGHTELQTPSKDKYDFRRKKQNILIEFSKVSPLKVVQLHNVSIANASIKSSEADNEAFEDLFNKINFQQVHFDHLKQSQNYQSPAKKIFRYSYTSQSKQNISGVSDNDSLSSRCSRASNHNSRIIGRIKEGIKGKGKIKQIRVQKVST